MTRRSLPYLLRVSVFTSATLLALSAPAYLQERDDDRQERNADRHDRDADRHERDHDRRERRGLTRLPTGQFVTPTAIRDSVQQYLNPGLAAYPNFIAGEAVRSQLSPDGATLAVLTAGQNSLYKPDGTVDVANSTQYIFLYDVAGANKARPLLTQVIKQVNAHVGLVFSPDGNTLYAAAATTTRCTSIRRLVAASRPVCRFPWATSPPDPPAAPGTKALASTYNPTPAAWTSPPTAIRWSSPTTTTTRSA